MKKMFANKALTENLETKQIDAIKHQSELIGEWHENDEIMVHNGEPHLWLLFVLRR